MGECLLTRRGGAVKDDIVVCSEDTLTCALRTWHETYASVSIGEHTIQPTKTSDSNGGSGFCAQWNFDVTAYSKLVIDLELTSVRNTTTARYLPMFGLASGIITSLSGTLQYVKTLVTAGATSLARGVYELDVSAASGLYYISYKGIATGTIYDFRLVK